jgi:hypothetical protein
MYQSENASKITTNKIPTCCDDVFYFIPSFFLSLSLSPSVMLDQFKEHLVKERRN